MKIQNKDMPSVLPFIPKACNSSITGAQSRLLSISVVVLVMDDDRCRLSENCVSDSAVSGRSVLFSEDVADVFAEGLATITVAGSSAAVKENRAVREVCSCCRHMPERAHRPVE